MGLGERGSRIVLIGLAAAVVGACLLPIGLLIYMVSAVDRAGSVLPTYWAAKGTRDGLVLVRPGEDGEVVVTNVLSGTGCGITSVQDIDGRLFVSGYRPYVGEGIETSLIAEYRLSDRILVALPLPPFSESELRLSRTATGLSVTGKAREGRTKVGVYDLSKAEWSTLTFNGEFEQVVQIPASTIWIGVRKDSVYQGTPDSMVQVLAEGGYAMNQTERAVYVQVERSVVAFALVNGEPVATTVLAAGSPRPGFTIPGALESEGKLWIGTGDYKAAEVTWYEVSGGALSPAWGKSVPHFTFQVSPAGAEVGGAAGR